MHLVGLNERMLAMIASVLPWRYKLATGIFAVLSCVMSGCGLYQTLDGKLHKGFGPEGTSVLGEVTYLVSREQIKKGYRDGYWHKLPPIYEELVSNGVSDQELIDGKIVVIVYQIYWHNQSRSHDWLDWAIVKKGVTVSKGNIVKVEVRQPYAMVTDVLYSAMEDGGCQYIPGERGGFSALNVVNPIIGGPGTANLYCPKLEQDGWQKTPYGIYKGGFIMTLLPNPK